METVETAACCVLSTKEYYFSLPSHEDNFEVTTDAPDLGVRAVLSQKGSENWAREQKAESDRTELFNDKAGYTGNCMGNREVEKIWQAFLFTTAHCPLTFLQMVQDLKGWIARVQEYDFQVRYKKGQDSSVVDCHLRAEYSLRPVEYKRLPACMNLVWALTSYDNLKGLIEQQHGLWPTFADAVLNLHTTRRNGDSKNGS